MVRFNIDYLGTTVVDKRFSNPMVPWVIADVKRRKKVQKITLIIENGEIMGVNEENVTLFRHHVQNIARFCHEANNMRTFMYLVRDEAEPVLHCYLYQTLEFEDVVEIFQTMKESVRDHPGPIPTKSHSSAASLTSLCPDISPSNSQFFEVLYVGKIRVSHRKVPNTFIDDALEKIRLHEQEKNKKFLEQNNEYQKSNSLEIGAKIINNSGDILHSENASDRNSDSSVSNSNENIKKLSDFGAVSPAMSDENIGTRGEFTLPSKNVDLLKTGEAKKGDSTCDISDNYKEKEKEKDGDSDSSKNEAESEKNEKIRNEIGYKRNRTGSLGVIEIFNKKRSDDSNHNHNRTMLFYVGRSDLRLISPDRKQVLLHKNLKDVISCIQGVQNNEHFGFISRDADCYVGYVFKCESNSVADDVVSVITQSFHATKECKEYKQPVLSCEHCPMVWFHKLCAEIEGLSDKKTQMTILKKIESLPVDEQDNIHTKFLGAESSDIKEQNEFLMILLRSHCEAKQTRHVHDTAENRSEFLNQYLGGNTIFMKAKRSLTSSFDQLLKRKGSQLDNSQSSSKESLNRKSDLALNECDVNGRHRSSTVGSFDGEKMRKELKNHCDNNPCEAELLKKQFHKEKSVERDDKGHGKKPSFPEIAAVAVNNQKIEKALQSSADVFDGYLENENCKTPMINIFLKVGSTTKTPPHGRLSLDESNQTPTGSWRQAIFNRVVTPGKTDEPDEREIRRRTKEELRDLWKKAINQQLLLIRMEKENARLRARQEEATVKRIKLEYDELGSCNKEYMGIWDLISTKDNRISSSKCDNQMLLQAIRQGIPRTKRGDIWHYLAVQFCLKQPPFDSTGFPNYDVCYEDLLKQLTSFQHAILIDLGRTFPNHPYFASPLGPGQLALFNLLKAYSLLDPQVGYCQGLSFVAGVLLLHLSEEMAFLLLRHLMFRRGLRKQYLPDMAALQVHLYQLSRLLHDTLPKLYEHFDRNEISPTLYAASWILTLFASQFPLGFVTRVFDLLFLENTTDIIFRVVMALLEEHKDELLSRSSFEEIMDYLKNDVPKMDSNQLEKIMKKVLTMDISKHLHEYEVEYHVLQEEMSTPRPEIEQLKRFELENRRLTDQNLALIDQLEIMNKQTARLEKSRTNQQATINRLETQIRNLEITIATLGDFISDVSEEYREIEIPGDIRRILTNLELAEQRSSKQFRNEQNLKKKLDKSAILRRSKTSMGFYEKKEAANLEELYSVDDLPNGTKFGDKYPLKDEKQEESSKTEPQKPVLKGVPLKVIVDDDDDDKRRVHQSAPNLTSKITSGVSSFFNSSHNQMLKNQKNKKLFQENLFIGNNKTNEEFFLDESIPTRQFSSEIGSLSLKDSIIGSQKKDKIIKTKECKSLNNLELSNVNHSDNSALCKNNSIIADDASSRIHPLDTCNDVNITYHGTTKLKSLKPGHRFNRNNTIDLIPINHDLLNIKEDYSESRQEKNVIDSKIFKVCDSVTEKF